MTAIEEIKERVDIVELVGESVRLRRSGKNYTGFCPFHHNVHTPSFAVFADTGTWRCFGACNEGGDIFRFVMRKDGVDFTEALRKLAERAGVELHPRSQEETRAEEEHARLRALLELAATFFRNHLLQSPEGARVAEYLHKRGFSDSTLETFQVGLAPAGWDIGTAFYRTKDYADTDLISAGISVPNDAGGLRDRFRNRITLPIRDASGRLCGFGARIVDPNDQPKFLNSPQSPLFDKGRLLFGLDRAARSIRASGEAVLVEGYMDVMAAHQAGFANVVSPMGTALTENQLRLLKRSTNRIIFALDPDSAGEAATLRGLEIAQGSMQRVGAPDHTQILHGDKSVELGTDISENKDTASFDSRGLIRFESRLRADLRVATMPSGKDPDEVLFENPEEWRKLIAEAKPVVLHVLQALIQGQNLDDPKVKAMIASRMIPILQDVDNKVERDTYAQHISRVLHVDDRMFLLGSFNHTIPKNAVRRGTRSKPESRSPIPAGTKLAPRESYNIGLLLRQPEILFRIDRSFGEIGLERISSEDFQEPAHAVLLELIRDSALQGEIEPEEYLAERLTPDLADSLQAAKESFQKYHGDEAPAPDEGLEAMLRLRQHTLERQLADLRFYLMEIEQPSETTDAAGRLAAQHEGLERMNRIRDGINRIQRALSDRPRSEAARSS